MYPVDEKGNRVNDAGERVDARGAAKPTDSEDDDSVDEETCVTVPDEMHPRSGFIPQEILVLAGVKFRQAISASGVLCTRVSASRRDATRLFARGRGGATEGRGGGDGGCGIR